MKTIAMDELVAVSGGAMTQPPMTIFNPNGPRPPSPGPTKPVPNPLPGLPGLPGESSPLGGLDLPLR